MTARLTPAGPRSGAWTARREFGATGASPGKLRTDGAIHLSNSGATGGRVHVCDGTKGDPRRALLTNPNPGANLPRVRQRDRKFHSSDAATRRPLRPGGWRLARGCEAPGSTRRTSERHEGRAACRRATENSPLDSYPSRGGASSISSSTTLNVLNVNDTECDLAYAAWRVRVVLVHTARR